MRKCGIREDCKDGGAVDRGARGTAPVGLTRNVSTLCSSQLGEASVRPQTHQVMPYFDGQTIRVMAV